MEKKFDEKVLKKWSFNISTNSLFFFFFLMYHTYSVLIFHLL